MDYNASHFLDQCTSACTIEATFSQSRTLTRSNASRVLVQRQTVNKVDKFKTNCGQRSHGRCNRTKKIERVWLTCSTSYMAASIGR